MAKTKIKDMNIGTEDINAAEQKAIKGGLNKAEALAQAAARPSPTLAAAGTYQTLAHVQTRPDPTLASASLDKPALERPLKPPLKP